MSVTAAQGGVSIRCSNCETISLTTKRSAALNAAGEEAYFTFCRICLDVSDPGVMPEIGIDIHFNESDLNKGWLEGDLVSDFSRIAEKPSSPQLLFTPEEAIEEWERVKEISRGHIDWIPIADASFDECLISWVVSMVDLLSGDLAEVTYRGDPNSSELAVTEIETIYDDGFTSLSKDTIHLTGVPEKLKAKIAERLEFISSKKQKVQKVK